MEQLEPFLENNEIFNYHSDEIQSLIKEFQSNLDQLNVAQSLYRKIRDLALYDPFHLDLRPKAFIASELAIKKRAWCVEKAVLLSTCFRGLGIPAGIGFATVINHLGTDKLEHYLRRKEIVFHGYTTVFLDNKWVRCTPAFDRRICAISKVPVLEWNGRDDSLFQQEIDEGKFMEYVHYFGEFSNIPFDLMEAEMEKHYPHLFMDKYESKEFSFLHSRST